MKKLVALVLMLTLLVSCTPHPTTDTYTGTWLDKDFAEKYLVGDRDWRNMVTNNPIV